MHVVVADPRWSTARSMPIASPGRLHVASCATSNPQKDLRRQVPGSRCLGRLAHHQQGGGKLDASDSLHCLWSLLFRSFISSEAELGRASVVVWHTARERTPSRVRTLRTQLHRKTVLTAAARTPGGGGGTDSPNARRDKPTLPNIGQYVVTIDT